jgi:ankyrin repeat protein
VPALDKPNATPLIEAAHDGEAKLVEVLLRARADPRKMCGVSDRRCAFFSHALDLDRQDRTALDMAMAHGHRAVLAVFVALCPEMPMSSVPLGSGCGCQQH